MAATPDDDDLFDQIPDLSPLSPAATKENLLVPVNIKREVDQNHGDDLSHDLFAEFEDLPMIDLSPNVSPIYSALTKHCNIAHIPCKLLSPRSNLLINYILTPPRRLYIV